MISARFMRRPHRFAVVAALGNGRTVEAHLADPGRLTDLLLPGATLRLRPAPDGTPRKTRFTVALVRSPPPDPVWVSVEAARANRLAEPLLARGALSGVPAPRRVAREVRHAGGRFDFRLEYARRRPTWVEVKSVTLAEDGEGLFPDAPTVRGARHVRELAALADRGDGALLLLVAQRGDIERVGPHDGIDPAFGDALREARRAGVKLRAVRFRLDSTARARYDGPLPVTLRRKK